jgi:hypothetical protein
MVYLYGHLVHLVVIWHILPVLVCCSEKNLATLLLRHPRPPSQTLSWNKVETKIEKCRGCVKPKTLFFFFCVHSKSSSKTRTGQRVFFAGDAWTSLSISMIALRSKMSKKTLKKVKRFLEKLHLKFLGGICILCTVMLFKHYIMAWKRDVHTIVSIFIKMYKPIFLVCKLHTCAR